MLKTARTVVTIAYNLATGSFREAEQLRVQLAQAHADANELIETFAKATLSDAEEITKLRQEVDDLSNALNAMHESQRMTGAARGAAMGALQEEMDRRLAEVQREFADTQKALEEAGDINSKVVTERDTYLRNLTDVQTTCTAQLLELRRLRAEAVEMQSKIDSLYLGSVANALAVAS